MNPKISKDLEELGLIVQEHHKKMGFDNETALKESVNLVKQIGRYFNRCRLYISVNESIEAKAEAVKHQMKKGCHSPTKISERTGIPETTVRRIKNKL